MNPHAVAVAVPSASAEAKCLAVAVVRAAYCGDDETRLAGCVEPSDEQAKINMAASDKVIITCAVTGRDPHAHDFAIPADHRERDCGGGEFKNLCVWNKSNAGISVIAKSCATDPPIRWPTP